jgi:hypothetical protein
MCLEYYEDLGVLGDLMCCFESYGVLCVFLCRGPGKNLGPA